MTIKTLELFICFNFGSQIQINFEIETIENLVECNIQYVL